MTASSQMPPKHPNDVLDYVFDFAPKTNDTEGGDSDWLASGETIASKTVTVDDGITKDSDTITDSNTSVTVWLSGGSDETDYDIYCEATTSASRKITKKMTVPVRS